MAFFKEIIKWVKGWRLDKAFKFNEAGQVTVQDAAIKAATFIGQFLVKANSPESTLIMDLVGGNIQTYFKEVIDIVTQIKSELETIELLEDIPEALKDYRFALDDKRNEFYHSIVNAGIVMVSDGSISIFDAAMLAKLVKDYIED